MSNEYICSYSFRLYFMFFNIFNMRGNSAAKL